MLTADLLPRPQAGDGEAFRELAESRRLELHLHRRRMLGSTTTATGSTCVLERSHVGGSTASER